MTESRAWLVFDVAAGLVLVLAFAWARARAQDTDPHLDLPVFPGQAVAPATSLALAGRTSASGGHVLPVDAPPPITDHEDEDPRDEPPPVFYGEEIESENGTLVYVLDISGSMRREGRIERARAELRRSILALSPSIRFNVVAYTCVVRVWSSTLRPADPASKAGAIAWADALVAYGATGTGPAMARALAIPEVMAVALLTDGHPNCGADGAEAHRRMIQSANARRATINVFGIAASGDYRAFCQNVASDAGGSYFDVP